MRDNKILSIYFGLPGAGKTTIAARNAAKCLKHGMKVYSNVPIKGTIPYEADDLGLYEISDGRVILDEAGIEFNNRDFKNFKKSTLAFFKLHRHYGVSIDVFSQGWDDMDKKIRTLAQKYYLVKRSIIPFFIAIVPIRRRIGVNEFTKEICDTYSIDSGLLSLFTTERFFAPRFWKMFDSFEAPSLPPLSDKDKKALKKL